ncbi:lipoate--protein ligase [Candidatus Mycoplasma pogonae]
MILVEPIRDGKLIKDGAYIMALQVWALNTLKIQDTLVFPFICDPHVQFGYFQNPEVETNREFLEKHNIPVVRRDTGGGAIYIDNNSVNFCFLIPDANNENDILGNYKKFYQPIINILASMGVKNLEQTGKNDLTINGKKVSGAAMLKKDDVIYGGYSLLYQIDYESMLQVLNPNRKKIESKGIQSVKQRVTELKDYLDPQFQNFNIYQFRDEILKRMFHVDNLDKVEKYVLTDQEWAQIDDLVAKKYKNWDWVYGLTPQYSYNRDQRFEGVGTINISLLVEESKIAKCKISGDFFTTKNLGEIEQGLIGTKMTKADLFVKLQNLNLPEYFFNKITVEDFVNLILS